MPKRCFYFACLLVFTATSVQAQDIDPAAVKQAIDRGIAYLKRQQKADGSWTQEGHDERCGSTAIAVIAMRSCGISPNDESIQRAMRYLRAFPGEQSGRIYSLALQTIAFCVVDPVRDLALIRQNVALLERQQSKATNEHNGGWRYTPTGDSDLSCSQFAILALYEAERVGVRVGDPTWRAALRYWKDTQNGDGGWGYTPQGARGSSRSSGSMTTAGIASLIISAGVTERGGATVQGDRIICFQRPDSESSRQIEQGINWLTNNFSVNTNPNLGSYLLYYLYALERVGRMTNQRFIGRHDWYRAGTEKILALQDSMGRGYWNAGGSVISDTSFALLFLSKGRRPVLMSKIQFGNDDAWNVHPNDVNNLTLFVETRPLWPSEMTWQVVDIQHATADHLLQSPVISFSARNWTLPPHEMEALAKKLREYLDHGGFIMAEAQPGGTSFDNTFRALMRRVFPEPGYDLTLLDRTHPIWGAEITIDPDYIRPIEGIHYGCRTSVVYVPPVEGKPSLSCLWEVYRHFNRDNTRYSEVVQRQIDNGLGIGLNILAYATSRELKGKDEILERVVRVQTDTDRRGRIFFPYLNHGATNPAPHAPQNLLAYLEKYCDMRIEHQASTVTLSDPSLSDYPILFTHGRGAFQISEEQQRRLRLHLEWGGFLFANAICSAEPFAESFQSEMRKVFPNVQWESIPLSDPIFSDVYGGFKIDTLNVRQIERIPGQEGTRVRERQVQPELYGIRLSNDDRWVVVFSPHDVSCALEKTSSLECRGYTQESALRLAANVMLYAIEHQ